jgi:ABC-type Fe3+ transport system substrate-binding protein
VLSGGFGNICLVNKAPHPNAAKLFVNWVAGPQGELAYSEATQAVSLRTDLKYTGIPEFMFPQKGTKYLDTYSWKFVTEQRDAAFDKVRELLNQ